MPRTSFADYFPRDFLNATQFTEEDFDADDDAAYIAAFVRDHGAEPWRDD